MIRPYEENGQRFYEVAVFVKDKDRRQLSKKQKGITSERKAKEIEFKLKTELLEIVEGTCNWTWQNWCVESLRRMRLVLKNKTIANYEGRLKNSIPQEWEERLLTSFTPNDIYKLIYEAPGDRNSPTNQYVLWQMLRRIFEMAVEEGIVNRNPAVAVKVTLKKNEQKVLTATEAQLLLDKSREVRHRFWGIWTFALMSGMRSGEMYAIRWTDINLESGTLSLTRQWTNKDGLREPKWGSSRIIPISEDFKAFLLEWRNEHPGFSKTLYDSHLKVNVTHGDYVLPALDEWTNGMQAEVLRDFCRTIGITEIRFHDLRATFITALLSQGAELAKVMMVVGHRKLGTTDKYLRKAGVPVKGVTEALSYRAPKELDGKNIVLFRPKSI